MNRETLAEKRILKGRYDVLKVLGKGKLTKKLTVEADRFSASAKEAIAAAGGTAKEVVQEAKKRRIISTRASKEGFESPHFLGQHGEASFSEGFNQLFQSKSAILAKGKSPESEWRKEGFLFYFVFAPR